MSEGVRFPVDATTILNMAASLGETNPIYYDEEYAGKTRLGGVIASPTFTMCMAHWMPSGMFRGVSKIPAPPAAAGDGKKRSGSGGRRASGERAAGGGDLMRVLHGEQRFEYHKPVRPGMTLRASMRQGETWEKEGRRGGKMRFSESISEYRDESGELVVTATSVGIVTSKAVE